MDEKQGKAGKKTTWRIWKKKKSKVKETFVVGVEESEFDKKRKKKIHLAKKKKTT